MCHIPERGFTDFETTGDQIAWHTMTPNVPQQ